MNNHYPPNCLTDTEKERYDAETSELQYQLENQERESGEKQIKNRKLSSYIYNGWRVVDAIKNAVKNPDVKLIIEPDFSKREIILLDKPKEFKYYLKSFGDKTYRVKLTEEEANYYQQLERNK